VKLNLFLMVAFVSNFVQGYNDSLINSTSLACCGSYHNGSSAIGCKNTTNRSHTMFGIGYEVWWKTLVNWTDPEATPVLGEYSSLDPMVISQHAEWISGAGIDFILVDLSNSETDIAVSGLDELLTVYMNITKHPKISILLDAFSPGTLGAKADLVKNYTSNPQYSSMFFEYKGKPLIIYYTGPTSLTPPNYTNPDFTVRFMGAFQEVELNPVGTWAWLDRTPIVDGPVTNVSDFGKNGLSGWTADPAWHLTQGKYVSEPDKYFPSVMYASSEPINNGTQRTGNITSPPFTITENAIQFNAIGTDLHAQAGLAQFSIRNIFLLKDAQTGEILRSASAPGSIQAFYMRQWNVRDLKGREVVFEAVNNANTVPIDQGWFGFFGLAQIESEFISVASFTQGNENGSLNWDAHQRYYGATLVYNMNAVFKYEPDIALVQQWNEFGAPDQYSVEASDDMEPTTITDLAGADSDGWGYYYLNLTTELIRQYRLGNRFPAVTLDPRYP